MRTIRITKAASKTLERMPRNVANTIIGKIEQYARDPASLANNVVKLQGLPGYRLRVGDWRVVFDDDGVVMIVEKIAPRGSVYG
ncbi:MAG: type II toxin-antitoxin system RelE family toxin [Ignavibacteriales bacterium]